MSRSFSTTVSAVLPRAALIGVCAIALSACGAAITSLSVPMTYTPTSRLELAKAVGRVPETVKIFVAPVTDNRTDTLTIGANREKAVAVPVLGDSSPGQFLRRAISAELRNAGVTIAATRGDATHTLQIGLTRFWTEESPSYRGEIVTRSQVLDRRGVSRWEASVAGTSRRFGRSLSVQNYQETFSDCVVSYVTQLLASDAFVQALKP